MPISPLPTGGRSAASVASSLEQASDALAVAGRPLDPETRAWSERLLNADLGSVSVHDGPRATAAADALGARAFTVGDAVVFGGDVGDAGTQEGRRTLLHELVHVVQGGGARAQRPVSVLPPSSPAESEASDLSGRSLASAVEVSAVGPVRHARTGAAETVACQPKAGAGSTPATTAAGDPNGVDLGGDWADDGNYWYFEEETGNTWVWHEPQKQWELLSTAADAIKVSGTAPPRPTPPPKRPPPPNPYKAWANSYGTRYGQRTGPFGIGALPVAYGASYLEEGYFAVASVTQPLAGPLASQQSELRHEVDRILDQWGDEAKENEQDWQDLQAEGRGDLYRLPVRVVDKQTGSPPVAVGSTKAVGAKAATSARVKSFAEAIKTRYRAEIVKATRQGPRRSPSEIGRVAEQATLEAAPSIAEANGLDPGYIWIGDFPVGVTGPRGGSITAEMGSHYYRFIIELKKSPSANRRSQTQAHEAAVEEGVNFDDGVVYYKFYGQNYKTTGVDAMQTPEPESEPVVPEGMVP